MANPLRIPKGAKNPRDDFFVFNVNNERSWLDAYKAAEDFAAKVKLSGGRTRIQEGRQRVIVSIWNKG